MRARERLQHDPGAEDRAAFERLRQDVTLEKRAEVAADRPVSRRRGRGRPHALRAN